MKRLLPFVLLGAVAACGGVKSSDPDASADEADADPDAPDADPDAPDAAGGDIDSGRGFGDDSIARDCAPDDGPAVRITIAEHIGLSCRPDSLDASLEILVWVHPITAPQTVIFNAENKNGAASACPGGLAPCQIASSGTIEFDAFSDGVGARGSYEIRFGDSVETGEFDASWCTPPDPVLCG